MSDLGSDQLERQVKHDCPVPPIVARRFGTYRWRCPGCTAEWRREAWWPRWYCYEPSRRYLWEPSC